MDYNAIIGDDAWDERESAEVLRSRGKRARKVIPRDALGDFIPVSRDPIASVTAQNVGRVENLIPLRHQRMAVSPFTFFRGSAGLMAEDLSKQVNTGVHIVICGDAHINNFGLYASPERRLVFDLNDFDEAASGPWEWDIRRAVTSVVMAAQEKGMPENRVKKIAEATARSYRQSLLKLVEYSSVERHFFSVDEASIARAVRSDGKKIFRKATKKARRRDSDQAILQMMEIDSAGNLKFKENPPVVQHVGTEREDHLEKYFTRYRHSTQADIAFLFARFTLTDIALRVVGVGSVGTRCYVLALTSPEGKGMIMQVKEARESVITANVVPNATTPKILRHHDSQGARVTSNQRILQAVSDPFLGDLRQQNYDYYVRQFRDAKGSFDVSQMTPIQFENYSRLCGGMLARAHSQSPWVHWIAGYLGNSSVHDRAVVRWSLDYAKQVEKDYEEFTEAISREDIPSY